MRRSLLTPALLLLALAAPGTGCGPGSDEPEARPAEATAPPSPPGPGTATEPPGSGPAPTNRPAGAPGDTDHLCALLEQIADADLEMSSTVAAERGEAMIRAWPGLALVYDDAVVAAPPGLAADLEAIKRISELVVDALGAPGGSGNPALVASEVADQHRDEVVAGGLASIRANRFTEDECGFSLNNE